MQYFVTGATGFIGKRLVKKLLERKGATVYFLIRKESAGKVDALRAYWGASAAKVIPIHGDLTSKKLGVSAEDVKRLKLLGVQAMLVGESFLRQPDLEQAARKLVEAGR